MNIYTPVRRKANVSQILEKSLIYNQQKHEWRRGLFWGSVNLIFLSILLYDISYTCPFYISYYYYGECLLILMLTFNIIYYVSKMMRMSLIKPEPVTITTEQKKLLGIADTDPNFKVVETLSKSPTVSPATPMNLSAASWQSNLSENNSRNFSLSSSWIYVKSSPSRQSLSDTKTSIVQTPSSEFIREEEELEQYLKKSVEKPSNQPFISYKSMDISLGSFWRNSTVKPIKDVSTFLKGQYQMASLMPVKTGSPINKEDKTPSPTQSLSSESVWLQYNIHSIVLTQWNENLRKWISQTILERLVTEFDRINTGLEKHGLNDVKIGYVGLERLRKTAHMMPVIHDVPSLLILMPFLEITNNQEYLAKRIRELAKGGCMSEFKWNGGSSYNGKDWDESLPTDSAVIMHLFACYLDTQLMPLPNMPDTKSFTGHYFIRSNDKMPNLTTNSILIQEVSDKPPHYRVFVEEKAHEIAKGYNNLFHTILYFIYHVNKKEQGMLGPVNLGKAGINILWVINE